MSVHSSRYPLIRISKTGEMRLKNKVGNAILKENAHEERALGSKLAALTKHRERQDKYLTYRQLDFATKQITASEERPHTIATTDGRRESLLPPINSMNLNESIRKPRVSMISEENTGIQKRTQGKWEKAITFVKLAVRNRPQPMDEDNTFITQQAGVKKRKDKRRSKQDPSHMSSLPLISQPADSNERRPAKRKPLSRQISLPEMLRMSREMSRAGLEDPRFLKLTTCLSREGGIRNPSESLTLTPATPQTQGHRGKRKLSQTY